MAWALPVSIALHAAFLGGLVLLFGSASLGVRVDPGKASTDQPGPVFLADEPARPRQNEKPKSAEFAPELHEISPAPELASEWLAAGEIEILQVRLASRSSVAASSLDGPDTQSIQTPPSAAIATSPAQAESATGPVPRPGNPAPVYPDECRRRRQEGTVTLRFMVSSSGDVHSVWVESGTGYSGLDKAALVAAERWRFTPALAAGRAVDSEVVVPVRFTLKSARQTESAAPR